MGHEFLIDQFLCHKHFAVDLQWNLLTHLHPPHPHFTWGFWSSTPEPLHGILFTGSLYDLPQTHPGTSPGQILLYVIPWSSQRPERDFLLLLRPDTLL